MLLVIKGLEVLSSIVIVLSLLKIQTYLDRLNIPVEDKGKINIQLFIVCMIAQFWLWYDIWWN